MNSAVNVVFTEIKRSASLLNVSPAMSLCFLLLVKRTPKNEIYLPQLYASQEQAVVIVTYKRDKAVMRSLQRTLSLFLTLILYQSL